MKLVSIFASISVLLAACGKSEPQINASTPEPTATIKAAVELTPEMARGKKIYSRCRSCHTLEEGGRNKVGPNLWAIYGSKTASKEAYAYSKAMRAADIVWDEETMDAYIQRPAAFMPGNKMTFIGLKNKEDRDAVQAYMKAKTTP